MAKKPSIFVFTDTRNDTRAAVVAPLGVSKPGPSVTVDMPTVPKGLRRYAGTIEAYVEERVGRMYVKDDPPSDYEMNAVRAVMATLPKRARAEVLKLRGVALPKLLELAAALHRQDVVDDAEAFAVFLWLAPQVVEG